MIKLLKSLLTPDPTPHPFQRGHVSNVVDIPQAAPGVESVKWGQNRIVSATVQTQGTSIEWDTGDKGGDRLKPVDLDSYDMEVIRGRQINPSKYKLVKPYVIAGEWTNAEIAKVIGMSVSWVERMAPRVRDAAKLRRDASPSPTGLR